MRGRRLGSDDVELDTLVKLCSAYQRLGWAVQKQLDDILAGEDADKQNPNAVKLIRVWLRMASHAGFEDADDLIDEIDARTTAES